MSENEIAHLGCHQGYFVEVSNYNFKGCINITIACYFLCFLKFQWNQLKCSEFKVKDVLYVKVDLLNLIP